MDRLTEVDYIELSRLCPGGVERDVDLSAISQWRIGGLADVLLRPASVTELANLRRWLHERGQAHVVIGQTTNLLFADAGLHVPCIQIGSRMGQISGRESEVIAQAGAWVPGLARHIMQAGLSGAEHICGIPGTLGGLICMNGGSQRKGIGSNVVEVESVTASGEMCFRRASDCGFAYRRSVYQSNNEIITTARLRFTPGDRASIRHEILSILAERRRKFPRKEPNCGSVFISDPQLYVHHGPPGAIVEKLGFKGRRVGGAQISQRHANFIVNIGGARANDVLTLISEISKASLSELGALLRAEVRYMTPDGVTYAASEAAPRSHGEIYD